MPEYNPLFLMDNDYIFRIIAQKKLIKMSLKKINELIWCDFLI